MLGRILLVAGMIPVAVFLLLLVMGLGPATAALALVPVGALMLLLDRYRERHGAQEPEA